MAVRVRELEYGEGLHWKDLRLRALTESPDAFAVTYQADAHLPDDSWHQMIDATAADRLSASLVAEIDGSSAGMAYCRVDENDRSVGLLFAMWVDPPCRRQGAGRALVEYALAWMRNLGALTVELTVTGTNDEAVHLYTSMGFIDTGDREPLRDGSTLQVIKMKREIG